MDVAKVLTKRNLILLALGWYLFNLTVSQSSIAYVLLGFALVFLVPGYAWIDLFVRTEDELERFVLAVAISISAVIISGVWMNLVFKIPVTKANVFGDIALITLAGLFVEWKGLIPRPKIEQKKVTKKRTRKRKR